MNVISLWFLLLVGLVATAAAFARTAAVRQALMVAAGLVFLGASGWGPVALAGALVAFCWLVAAALGRAQGAAPRRILLVVGIGGVVSAMLAPKVMGALGVRAGEGAGAGDGSWSFGAIGPLAFGLSYLGFELIAFLADTHARRLAGGQSVGSFLAWVLYFPKKAAGPITRMQEIEGPLASGGPGARGVELAGAVELVGRGFAKKLLVANSLAPLVDGVFAAPSLFSAGTVRLAVVAYSIQILCDFSGYTDIVRGASRLLGVPLPENFSLPYSAQSVTEFWQRWHMSLSRWLRDYLFLPVAFASSRWVDTLGLSNRSAERSAYLVGSLVTMSLCGLWHGIGWGFLLWGAFHGVMIALERLVSGARAARPRWNGVWSPLRAVAVFGVVSLSWIPFRATDLGDCGRILGKVLGIGTAVGIEWLFVPALFWVPVWLLGGLVARVAGTTLSTMVSGAPARVVMTAGYAVAIFYFAPLQISPFVYVQF